MIADDSLTDSLSSFKIERKTPISIKSRFFKRKGLSLRNIPKLFSSKSVDFGTIKIEKDVEEKNIYLEKMMMNSKKS